MTEIKTRKKLIEVALPLDAINKASIREKSIRKGHPSTFHLWWARRPLAAARAILFAQLVDDPSENQIMFPTIESQNTERERLFELIKELIKWENTDNQALWSIAKQEIAKSWQQTCKENKAHPLSEVLFNEDRPLEFHDPFAGGGSIPLEAQRMGLNSFASDINPVAVLINKGLLEIPGAFGNTPPINPESNNIKMSLDAAWENHAGLTADIQHYAQWLETAVKKNIGHLYPPVTITKEIIKERPELNNWLEKQLPVIGWFWCRAVKSPNPAYANCYTPLCSTFILSHKKNRETYVQPIVEQGEINFKISQGIPDNFESLNRGSKLGRGSNFKCLFSGAIISREYIQKEFKGKRSRTMLMGMVLDGGNQRIFISPSSGDETLAASANPAWLPDIPMNESSNDLVSGRGYGIKSWSELFTKRQLVALETLTSFIPKVREKVLDDISRLPGRKTEFENQQLGDYYADAICLYLGLNISRQANRCSSVNTWDNKGETIQQVFGRQAIPMVWDFVEVNPFSNSTGNFLGQLDYLLSAVRKSTLSEPKATVKKEAAQSQTTSKNKIVSTDPPYYDNVAYADLSDFFYIWLRKSLNIIFPDLFDTILVPKTDELTAFTHRHGSKQEAETFFRDGMKQSFSQILNLSHPAFPITVYYAYKQSENITNIGEISTGWETFLTSLIDSGFVITSTWPVRTEYTGNLKKNTGNLASSVVLVCRKRTSNPDVITRSKFIAKLKKELPVSISLMQKANLQPVDMAQASIGPGMSIFTQYSSVIDSSGNSLSVREALSLINSTLDEFLSDYEGNFDSETRFAMRWFETTRFAEGDYGIAQGLELAMNLSVEGVAEAGIIQSGGGKVRLLQPEELSSDWDPTSDSRLTAWEAVHHLIKNLDSGEESAAQIFSKLSSEMTELTKELAYRLYSICEQKNWVEDGFKYNTLIQSWPEIERLARLEAPAQQGSLI